VLEVIKTFEAVSGQKLNYDLGSRRPGDVEQVYGDVHKAESQLGWKAKLDLSDMMRSAWAWEKYLVEHPIL
jgi:UDP-glucose 4-epimerase